MAGLLEQGCTDFSLLLHVILTEGQWLEVALWRIEDVVFTLE